MKWQVLGFVLCLASFSEQGALKCVPGKDTPCVVSTEQNQTVEVTNRNGLMPGKNCLPGSQWKSRCNDCTCSAEGVFFCTDKACPGQENEKESKCGPGSEWKDDCNTCWCVDGEPLCTRIGCSGIVVTDFNPERNDEEKKIFFPSRLAESDSKPIVCPPNRMFVKDCNTCSCDKDGTSYVCTRRVCLDNVNDIEKKQESKLKCKPNETFVLDCNTCRCSADGTSYACTRRACSIEEKTPAKAEHARKIRAAQQETPKNCQPGQEFRMDCNKCLCDNEGQNYSCTRIDCTSISKKKKREISSHMKAECVPGSEFKQRCNVCRCTADGAHATCTAKRCKDDDVADPDSAASFRCNPGEQFKRGCNDCMCSADGKDVFCTLRLCEQDINI